MSRDPFYIVKQEIQETVDELQKQLQKYTALPNGHTNKISIESSIEAGHESIKWQLQELEQAVERAAANPDKFQLGQQEISSRKDWIFKTRRQADGIMSTMKAGKKGGAGAAAAAAAASTSVIPQHLMSEQEKQQLMMRQQDSNLEDIEQAVARIGNIGKTIGNELDSQGRMLSELEDDMDTTHSRLKAAQVKMQDIIKRSGVGNQLYLIGGLILTLVLLTVLAFY